MSEPQILIAGTNPYGSFEAIVEDDGRTVYLYLQAAGDSGGMRPLWVANRVPAPEEEDIAGMQQGLAPLMPRPGTRHPEGHPGLDAGRLSLLWLEEGDSVALLEGDTPIAVVPPWAGFEGCPGYAAEASGEQRLAWDLAPALEGLQPRLDDARDFWKWRSEPTSWEQIRSRGLMHLERVLGKHERYWAADGGRYPPRAVVQFAHPTLRGVSVLTTLGMSAQRMPKVDLYFEDAAPYRRVELALATEGDPQRAAALLAGMMKSPWENGSWLGDFHTYAFGPPSPALGESAVLLLRNPPPEEVSGLPGGRTVPPPNLSGLRDRSGDEVRYLWVIPINEAERSAAEEDGSEKLVEALEAQRRGWVWGA